jgi:hypothetical protein
MRAADANTIYVNLNPFSAVNMKTPDLSKSLVIDTHPRLQT